MLVLLAEVAGEPGISAAGIRNAVVISEAVISEAVTSPEGTNSIYLICRIV
jgi:hypothetical protein